mmetsp:Transcript_29755/g.54136  ORF Transcript_29755/g.54136 Transcript_29755/m.54136 type:complete len:249 (-) Transcript_29755:508-1254(-)
MRGMSGCEALVQRLRSVIDIGNYPLQQRVKACCRPTLIHMRPQTLQGSTYSKAAIIYARQRLHCLVNHIWVQNITENGCLRDAPSNDLQSHIKNANTLNSCLQLMGEIRCAAKAPLFVVHFSMKLTERSLLCNLRIGGNVLDLHLVRIVNLAEFFDHCLGPSIVSYVWKAILKIHNAGTHALHSFCLKLALVRSEVPLQGRHIGVHQDSSMMQGDLSIRSLQMLEGTTRHFAAIDQDVISPTPLSLDP